MQHHTKRHRAQTSPPLRRAEKRLAVAAARVDALDAVEIGSFAQYKRVEADLEQAFKVKRAARAECDLLARLVGWSDYWQYGWVAAVGRSHRLHPARLARTSAPRRPARRPRRRGAGRPAGARTASDDPEPPAAPLALAHGSRPRGWRA